MVQHKRSRSLCLGSVAARLHCVACMREHLLLPSSREDEAWNAPRETNRPALEVQEAPQSACARAPAYVHPFVLAPKASTAVMAATARLHPDRPLARGEE
jgi:hypothetical protein